MEVRIASQPSPDRADNEDFAFALPNLVGVLDGVSAPAGLDTGCVHGPAWYVRRLAARLTGGYLRSPQVPLPQMLAEAIEAVRGDHAGRCDLAHPGTPASTVCLLKETPDQAEYLILSDSRLVIDDGHVRVLTDERFELAVADLRTTAVTGRAPIGSRDHAERVRHVAMQQRQRINRPDGYWIAAADPAAAQQAVQGVLPVRGPGQLRRAALLTDGAAAAVEQFQLLDWQGVLDVLTIRGPQNLIDLVRAAERADTDGHSRPRYKRHDDATAALCVFASESSP